MPNVAIRKVVKTIWQSKLPSFYNHCNLWLL